MSNYGWVPRPYDPPDDYLERAAMLVERRPNMEMIAIVNSLHDFVEEANTRATPPPPIDDDLVVAGHGASVGRWFVSPFITEPETTFESLDETMSVPARSIAIPDPLIGFDPANPQPTARAFHVKGCSMGTARPWLVKLREALGNHVRVTAPRHYHGVSSNGTAGVTPVEVIEWMAYELVVFQKTAFSTLNSLAAAFYAKGVIRPDGNPITLGSYKAWLKTLRVKRYDRPAARERDRSLPLGLNIGGRNYAEGMMGFYIQTPATTPVVKQIFQIPPPDVIPATDAERVDKLSSWFPADEIYRDTHPFPWFQRIGYPTLADMINGLKWKFDVDTTVSPPTIKCLGGPELYDPGVGQQVAGLATAANADPPLRPPRAPAPLVTLAEELFVIASTDDLTTQLGLIGPRGAIEIALRQHLAENPATAGSLQVVPRHEAFA